MTALADVARAAGLPACARIIAAYKPGVPPAAPPDGALAAPRASHVGAVIDQLVRRGLDPALVAVLRDAWIGRPLDRALLAWDLLNGALLPPALVDELRGDARDAAAVLPKPGRGYLMVRPETIEELVDSLGVPMMRQLSAAGLENAVAESALGADRIAGVVPDARLLELRRQFARLLHRAHLPTLASFHLADLYFHHHHRAALVDLIEVLLDAEAPDVESWLAKLDEDQLPMVELVTYVRVRTANNKENWDQALQFAEKHRGVFDSLQLTPAKAATVNPRPTLAYAEACLRNGKKTVPYEHVAALTNVEPPWRYAFRVMTVYAATRIKDAQFVTLLGMFLEKFGNDSHVWYDSLAVAPDDVHWGRGLIALLAREAETLPHDPAVWKSAALLMGDDDAGAGYDEVVARLRAQATLG
jgi:hypothetical protein